MVESGGAGVHVGEDTGTTRTGEAEEEDDEEDEGEEVDREGIDDADDEEEGCGSGDPCAGPPWASSWQVLPSPSHCVCGSPDSQPPPPWCVSVPITTQYRECKSGTMHVHQVSKNSHHVPQHQSFLPV